MGIGRSATCTLSDVQAVRPIEIAVHFWREPQAVGLRPREPDGVLVDDRHPKSLAPQDQACSKSGLEDKSRTHPKPAAAVNVAARLMTNVLSPARYSVRGHLYFEMRRDLPYALLPTELPHKRILVNRDYKPVGSNTPTVWMRCEDYPNLHFKLDGIAIAGVSPRASDPGSLFNDGCPPWRGRSFAQQYLGRFHAAARDS